MRCESCKIFSPAARLTKGKSNTSTIQISGANWSVLSKSVAAVAAALWAVFLV